MDEQGECGAVARTTQAVADARQSAETAIHDYPMSVSIGAFAVGLGAGAMLGAALARPLGFRRSSAAETLGHRVLESLGEYLPASVQRQLGM